MIDNLLIDELEKKTLSNDEIYGIKKLEKSSVSDFASFELGGTIEMEPSFLEGVGVERIEDFEI